MPSAVPVLNTKPKSQANGGAAAASASDLLSANDNIRRFQAPSRPLSPPAAHTLFHTKTRCFV